MPPGGQTIRGEPSRPQFFPEPKEVSNFRQKRQGNKPAEEAGPNDRDCIWILERDQRKEEDLSRQHFKTHKPR